jgi:hypothetical protein
LIALAIGAVGGLIVNLIANGMRALGMMTAIFICSYSVFFVIGLPVSRILDFRVHWLLKTVAVIVGLSAVAGALYGTWIGISRLLK